MLDQNGLIWLFFFILYNSLSAFKMTIINKITIMRGKANNDAILRCKIRQELQKHIRRCQHKKFSPHIVAAQVINNCTPYSFKGFLKDMCFTGDLYCIFDQSEQKYRINDKVVYIVLRNKLDFLQKKADYYIKAFDYFEQIKSYFRDSIKQAIETDKQYQYGSHNLQKYSLIIANFNESHKSFYPILKELLDLHLASLE